MKALLSIAAVCVLVVGVWSDANAMMGPMTSEQMLGKMLYFDRSLSNPAGQACADCHLPSAGFADPDQNLPVSEGVIPGRFGGRNSPSAAYASFSPPFHFDFTDGLWYGGQFWDGRALDLQEQALGPFLNPVEMNNTKAGVINAVRRSTYASLFRQVYGKSSLNNVDKAYVLVAKAIAAFETTPMFGPFTSKYDYYLQGKVQLSQQEMRGLALFNGKAQCALCHPGESPDGKPLFTDFSYDNLGMPVNPEIEALIGAPQPVDLGLGGVLQDPAEMGKFKVMTLRNLGKTAPYGHNGYFKDLKSIVHFYNTRDVAGAGWPAPEYPDTVNVDELGNLGLTSAEEDDVVAFLLTLTDGYRCRRCN